MSSQFPIQPFERVKYGTLVRKSGVLGKEVSKWPDAYDLPHSGSFGALGIVIPVYGFQHGGPIQYAASKTGDPFRHMYMGFDSGLAGMVFVSGRRVKQLTTRKRDPQTVEQIEVYLIEQVRIQSEWECSGWEDDDAPYDDDFEDGCEGLQELLRI